jgi:hypothetical protein
MDNKKKLFLFIPSFILPLIFYRILVVLKGGSVSYLRALTGLKFHHYHYGVLLITIAIILILFHKISSLSIILSGLGLGTILDGFISSLFFSSTRIQEIINYQGALIPTLILFVGVMLIILFVSRKHFIS